MRNIVFWSLIPLLAPQALYVRKTAPRFAGAAGPQSGIAGEGRKYRLLAVGDSIIAGVGAGRLNNALVGTTSAALARSLDASIHWQAIGGIGYKSSRVIEEFLPALPAEPADFIIVSVGVNDVTGLTGLSVWRQNLGHLLRRLVDHSPNAAIAVAGLPPMGDFPLLPQPLRSVAGLRASAFDTAGRDEIAGIPGAAHVPVHFDPSPHMFSADGYHPSEAGYLEFGKVMAEQLLKRS